MKLTLLVEKQPSCCSRSRVSLNIDDISKRAMQCALLADHGEPLQGLTIDDSEGTWQLFAGSAEFWNA